MGNTVVWKPAPTAVYSAYFLMELLEAAGLPAGVINMVPGPAPSIGDAVLTTRELAGIHFTGSTAVFQSHVATVGENIDRYRSYPRLVGETGGKDFIVAHPSADAQALATAIVRGALRVPGPEVLGGARASTSRRSMWPTIRERAASTRSTRSRWATSPTSATSWAP